MELIVALLKAFVVGGCICVIAQLFIELTPYSITPAHILVGYVVSGAVISALGLYQPIVDFAGAGATVPLTGFGYNLSKGVKEAIGKDGFLGVFTGGLKACAGGIAAAVFAGLVASLIFKAKDKS